MSKVCDFTGKKRSIQRSHRHAIGKSRSGGKAFAPRGPQGLRGPKKLNVQNVNLVKVKTPAGSFKVSMKVYKTYFKKDYASVKEVAGKNDISNSEKVDKSSEVDLESSVSKTNKDSKENVREVVKEETSSK